MVFVVNADERPLSPCTERRARILIRRKAARIHRMYPFTIRLVEQKNVETVERLTLKIDPGSHETGMALVKEEGDGSVQALAFFNIINRGKLIKDDLKTRSSYRRRRRSANLRYRKARFDNRRRPEGWLPPSLQHRVDTTMAWVQRLTAIAPVSQIWIEQARFDTRKLQDPEISGVEYQRGELFGYELREYLLEKWGRQCVYCGKKNVPLQIEHIVPKSRGGSDRVSNLTLACEKCNQKKGSKPIEVFLEKDPDLLESILKQTKTSLRDAAAMNSTRNAIVREVEATGIATSCFTGGRTKFNRSRLGIPKEHWLDALCVGEVGSIASGWEKLPVLHIRCTGRGSYQRARPDRYGFTAWHYGKKERNADGIPCGHSMRQKRVHGFATGDMIEAIVTKGKKKGVYEGRVKIRSVQTDKKTGKKRKYAYFDIATENGLVAGIRHTCFRLIHRNDGYNYTYTTYCYTKEKECVSSSPYVTGK